MLPFIESEMCYPILYSQKNALVNKSFFIKFMLSYLLFHIWLGLILVYRLVIKEQVLIMNCDKREGKKNFDGQIWYNDTEDNIQSTILISWSFIYVQLQEK